MYSNLLNTTITVQARTITQNSATGDKVETWADSVSLAARVQANGFSENRSSRQEYSESTHQAFIEYNTSLSVSANRVSFGGQYYDIVGIENLGGENRYTLLRLRLQNG